MSIATYLRTYKDLFVGRDDDYALQLSNGRYRRVGQPLTINDISDHLLGVRTYGTYVMSASGHCRFAVIDADTEDGLTRLCKIQDELQLHGIASSVERSRRGGHLWIFFTQPARASSVRAWLLPFCPGDMEFYPKQDEGKGYGSLIRLPLGIHRKSGRCYPFIERSDTGIIDVTSTQEERLSWFLSRPRVDVPQLRATVVPPTATRHTSFSLPQRNNSNGVSPIRQWNAEQDPYQVISQYVPLSEKWTGRCPFGDHHQGGEDRQASFKVYRPGAPGGYCWYCYTWQRGGSVFDFLRYYHHLDAQELWKRIQAEEV